MREKKGISQVELAKQAGISRNTIIKIENEEEVIVSSDTMIKLANALNVKVVDIFLM